MKSMKEFRHIESNFMLKLIMSVFFYTAIIFVFSCLYLAVIGVINIVFGTSYTYDLIFILPIVLSFIASVYIFFELRGRFNYFYTSLFTLILFITFTGMSFIMAIIVLSGFVFEL